MKKYIAILSFIVLFGSLSCRNANEEGYEETWTEEQADQSFYAKDSATTTTLDDDDKEIPRKDLQQWRQKP